jgi:hypothetical protein
MVIFETAIGPADHPSKSVVGSAIEARMTLGAEIKELRGGHPADAEELNGVLDELEAAGLSFATFFTLDGEDWSVWYRPVG